MKSYSKLIIIVTAMVVLVVLALAQDKPVPVPTGPVPVATAHTVEAAWPGRLTTTPNLTPTGSILCWKPSGASQPTVYGNCVVLAPNWMTLGLTHKWRWITAKEFDYAVTHHTIVTVDRPSGF